jgi:excisionase family DNA binding protein
MNRKLTQQEMDCALHQYPPILTPEEAAKILQLKLSTLYRHLSEGKYNSAVKRGKPIRFWRDRLIQDFMMG